MKRYFFFFFKRGPIIVSLSMSRIEGLTFLARLSLFIIFDFDKKETTCDGLCKYMYRIYYTDGLMNLSLTVNKKFAGLEFYIHVSAVAAIDRSIEMMAGKKKLHRHCPV